MDSRTVIVKKRGRENEEPITLFQSVGAAIEDVADASWVYREATKRSLGTEIDPRG